MRPSALLPQLLSHLKARKFPVLFIWKEGRSQFSVTSENLKEGTDAGEVIIQEFREAFEAGRVDLGSVFQQIQNDQLRAIPEIRILLELKGLGEDAGDSGE